MKILNLYAGIGGNRKLWGDEHQITAVERDEKILSVYRELFPNDVTMQGDAHEYLLKNYKKYDFIWSSPPCPTHSITNNFLHSEGVYRYPDMALYQEIIYLKHFFKGKWVVENVKSYYEPLIKPFELARHYFWANYIISNFEEKRKFNIINARACSRQLGELALKNLEEYHGFDLSKFKGNKRLWLRNCVNPKIGKHVFDCAFKTRQVLLS